MGLTKYEKETVINFNDAEKIASLSTAQDWMKRRIKKLAEKYPDDVKIKDENQYHLMVELPAKWIRVSPPRFVSEEQRAAASERLKAYRKKKLTGEIVDETESEGLEDFVDEDDIIEE